MKRLFRCDQCNVYHVAKRGGRRFCGGCYKARARNAQRAKRRKERDATEGLEMGREKTLMLDSLPLDLLTLDSDPQNG